MEEKKLVAPISEEKFKEQIHQSVMEQTLNDFEKGILHLRDYSGVSKFKSIRRAIKRGHVSIFGEVYPKRPFKNIKTSRGSITYLKRRYYEQLTHKNKKVC